MEINDQILKYLAGTLSDIERSEFEKILMLNSELKNEFDDYKNQLKEFKKLNEIDVNEVYFINLIPYISDKMEKRKSRFLFPRFALILPLIILIIVLVFYSNNSSSISNIVAELPENSQQEIVNYIDKENNYIRYEAVKDFENIDIIEKEISNRIDIESINLDLQLNYIDDYVLINSLSTEDLEIILNNMKNKKIL